MGTEHGEEGLICESKYRFFMQPNPWDDDEPVNVGGGEVSIQDSAIGGDVHTGTTIHNHDHNEQPGSTVFTTSPQQIVIPEPIIVGMPQQMNPQMGQQVMYLQQQSSAPKVLGIFVIIWGAFSFLGVISWLIPTSDPITGEKIIVPVSVIIVNIVNSLIAGFMCVLGGYWMTQYQKRGIHLVLIGITVSYFIGLSSIALGGDAGLGELIGNDSAVFTIIAVIEGICSVICGLLVAIPLMTAAPGLDDSSLFRRLK